VITLPAPRASQRRAAAPSRIKGAERPQIKRTPRMNRSRRCGYPESFVAGVGGGLLQEEESDEQVAAQPTPSHPTNISR